MSTKFLVVKGARQHNLQNITVKIPKYKFIVITGVSGSGKSSLAFDTLYAEGQRRYVESLSAYARQFLGQMQKPDVDQIIGLSPAISIEQKTSSHNPRSTVGTVTEIYYYLRLLYARIGHPHCPKCGKEIVFQSIPQMVDQILQLDSRTRFLVLSPIVEKERGTHKKIFTELRREGFLRVRIDGEITFLDDVDEVHLQENKNHTIEIIVDRLIVKEGIRQRLTEALETALDHSNGKVIIAILKNESLEERRFSNVYGCADCGITMGKLEPHMFSFNSPKWACAKCGGLGEIFTVDPELLIGDWDKSLTDGRFLSFRDLIRRIKKEKGSLKDFETLSFYEALGEKYGFTMDMPLREFPKRALKILLYGSHRKMLKFKNKFGEYNEKPIEGIIPLIEGAYKEAEARWHKTQLESVMRYQSCPECRGKRLCPESLAVTVGGLNISELCQYDIDKVSHFFTALELSPREEKIGHEVIKEIQNRLKFLLAVGVPYLTLDRTAKTLSGGESQRIRLATQIGSNLRGVLYILDEPSIGLHYRDKNRLIQTLKELRDLKNTVIVVEHDEDTMKTADFIVDLGPGGGDNGGHLIAAGSIEEIMNCPNSITGHYLTGKRTIPIPQTRRKPNKMSLVIKGAAEFNLKNIDVPFPLGLFICVTGVSGSGKSTLVNNILHKALAQVLHRAQKKPGKHKEIEGIEHLNKVILIDQSPIGRTPRSNPATYSKVFDHIRDLFAKKPESRRRGYSRSRFSFNLKGGRCDKCKGGGQLKIRLFFLPDVFITCDECNGQRYKPETLQIRYKDKNIYDVLEMTIEEALSFFSNIPKIKIILQTLFDVGLGYMKLGQPATTLSGGEAQRVKLAKELSRPATGKTLYILDEPTTGLHSADVQALLNVLQRLVDHGNTVVVIEHNLDVIKTADWLIDLGPEGGEKGGYIVATGSPEEIANVPESYTGQALESYLRQNSTFGVIQVDEKEKVDTITFIANGGGKP
ncbi:MAG: excinuclease ABC subunit UvrA [Promethearchaeota archaeon]